MISRTLVEQRWSRNASALVVAVHYIWCAGSDLQKSAQGLFRSLLYQIVGSDPKQASDGAWDLRELLTALKRVEDASDRKVCFFIDGLDENHPQSEHRQLIQSLFALSLITNDRMCVASRPWDDFQDAFGTSSLQIRREDLSYPDILQFAAEEMQRAANTRSRFIDEDDATTRAIDDLSRTVARRVRGVFSWVHYVVDCLKDHIKALSDLQTLHAYVERFPEELEQYCKQLIHERKDTALRRQTANALMLALVLQNIPMQTPHIWAYLCLAKKSWIEGHLLSKIRSCLVVHPRRPLRPPA